MMSRSWSKILGGLALAAVFLGWNPSLEAAAFRDGSDRLRDRARALAERFSKESRYDAQTRLFGAVQEADRKPFAVGDEESFFVQNFATSKKNKKKAVLQKIGKHCLIYVEKGQTIDEKSLKRIVEWFDTRIHPINTAWFGSEWTPGIDHEPRITLLFLKTIHEADGFFDPDDEYTRDKCPESNEREMLYLSMTRLEDLDEMMGTLVGHEFQHLIHWNHDPKEVSWVDEGCSESSCPLFGATPYTLPEFFANPSRNLTDWADTEGASNYSHVFLFARYLVTHAFENESGRQALTRAIVAEKQHGIAGVAAALKTCHVKKPFSAFFRDFCAALYLHRAPGIEAGSALSFDPAVLDMLTKNKLKPLDPIVLFGTGPFEAKGKVKMWSSTAIEVPLTAFSGKLRLDFAAELPRATSRAGAFDLGVAFMEETQGYPTVFKWLAAEKNTYGAEITIPKGPYRRMMVIVCNQGPVKFADQEQPLPPVPFVCSVTRPGTPAAANAGTVTRAALTSAVTGSPRSRSGRPTGRTDRRAFQKMLAAYTSAPDAEYGEAVLDILQTEFERDPVEAQAMLAEATAAIESETSMTATAEVSSPRRQALAAFKQGFEARQAEARRFENLHQE